MNNPSDEDLARIEKKFLAAYTNGRKPKPLELPPPNPKVLSWIDEAIGCGFPVVFTDKLSTFPDMKLGDFSSYKMPVFSVVEEPVDPNCKIKSPITCPRDHHTMPDPCRRDYCSCSCDFCKQSCGETSS